MMWMNFECAAVNAVKNESFMQTEGVLSFQLLGTGKKEQLQR